MIKGKIVVLTIEVRMTSSRLPGKVLLLAGNKPMLQILIERVRLSKYVDDIVVATTTNKSDEPIINLCKIINVNYYCGSENNVLERVCGAARSTNAEIIVEITGDDILQDPQLIDHALTTFGDNFPKHRYVANTGAMPWGFDIKIFSANDLYEINNNNPDELDKEHVSYSFYRKESRGKYNPYFIQYSGELNRPELRLTLDYKEDYELIKTIYEDLNTYKPNFSSVDIIRWLDEHPDLRDKPIKLREELEKNTLLTD